MTNKKTVKRHSSHDIDSTYLLLLQEFYEKKFINWLELEGLLVEVVASLDINLATYKGNVEDKKYLFTKSLIATLAEVRDSVSLFMFSHEKLKYEKKNLAMKNAQLVQQNELLQQELKTLRHLNNQ